MPPATDLRLVARWLAGWTAALSVATGVLDASPFARGFDRFGGAEYLARAAALAIVREHAASIAALSALLTLIRVAHGFDVAETVTALPGWLRRVLPACVLAAPFAGVLALAAAVITLKLVHGAPVTSSLSAATAVLSGTDVLAGVRSLAISVALMALLSWTLLPLLARSGWPVLRKIAVTILAVTAIWFALGALWPATPG